MRFEFRCKETDGGIGFEARGCGLGYYFDGRSLTLDVLHLYLSRPLMILDLGNIFPRNPLLYAEFIEKAAQINALLYSSNQTLNLCETIDIKRLMPVIWQLVKTANLSHCIEMKNYVAFSDDIADTYGLNTFNLSHTPLSRNTKNSFTLTLRTKSGTAIRTHGESAHSCISLLADQGLRDLIAQEFSNYGTQEAQRLIALSARLSTIARILDINFDPGDKLLISKQKNKKNLKENTPLH